MMTFNRKVLILLYGLTGFLFAQSDSTGIRFISERKFEEAQRFFESAIKKNDKNAESYYYLSLVLMRQQKLDEAEDQIDEAIDRDENISKYHLVRGQILGLQAREANIISQGFMAPKIKNAFLRASELDPENIDAHQALYNYYIMAPGIMGGSKDKALQQANTVVDLDPARGYQLLANYYLRVDNDTARAEKELENAIASDPNRGLGYKQLGYFEMNRGRFPKAYMQMQKYIDCEPDNPDSYDSYGDVLKADKKYEQAVTKYLYTLSIDKTFSPSIYSLAECYELMGMKQKAKETYQWYLSVEPRGRRSESAKNKINEL